MSNLTSKTRSKEFTYHTSYHYEDENGKHSFLTQLYQVGVYGIIDGRPELQGSYKPKDIVKIEKKLKKLEEEGKIKNLDFGRKITVTTDERGLWKEIK